MLCKEGCLLGGVEISIVREAGVFWRLAPFALLLSTAPCYTHFLFSSVMTDSADTIAKALGDVVKNEKVSELLLLEKILFIL